MTILWGDTGKVAYGVLKTINLSYPTPYENLYATPITLGTTQPGTPTDTYTLQSSDVPNISAYSIQTTGLLCVGGKNTNASTTAVYVAVYKNGTSVFSGNSNISASQYWTLDSYNLFGLKAGDKIDVYVWCPSGGVNYDYIGLQVRLTQPIFSKASIITNASYTLGTPVTFTKGNPTAVTTYGWQLWANSNSNNLYLDMQNNQSGLTFSTTSSGYGFGRVRYGDFTQGSIWYSDATYRPKYLSQYFPTQISFREVLR